MVLVGDMLVCLRFVRSWEGSPSMAIGRVVRWGGGGNNRGVANKLHMLQLILQSYLMGLPLLGPPLHLTPAICNLPMSAQIHT